MGGMTRRSVSTSCTSGASSSDDVSLPELYDSSGPSSGWICMDWWSGTGAAGSLYTDCTGGIMLLLSAGWLLTVISMSLPAALCGCWWVSSVSLVLVLLSGCSASCVDGWDSWNGSRDQSTCDRD